MAPRLHPGRDGVLGRLRADNRPIPTVDIRSLVIAALLVAILFAFEYGERLQSDSDEIA